jgi:FkbM family methyltransferase
VGAARVPHGGESGSAAPSASCPQSGIRAAGGSVGPIAGSLTSLFRLGRLQGLLTEALRLVDLLSLAPRGRARRRMLLAWCVLAADARRAVPRRPRVRVGWAAGDRMLSAVVSDTSELRVVHEVFVRDEYELPSDIEPRVIVDLGSNVGISVLLFKSRYPEARVVAVEPQPASFALLRENTRHLEAVTTVHAAIAAQGGLVTLYSGARSWAASTVPGAEQGDRHDVPALTFDTLAEQESLVDIDVLKMDVEGAETAVLASPTVHRCEVIIFEFHGEHSPRSLWSVLDGLPDFELVRVRDDTQVHALVTLRRRRDRA